MTISLNLKPPTCTFSAKESNKSKEIRALVEFCENRLTLSNHILRKPQLLRGRKKVLGTHVHIRPRVRAYNRVGGFCLIESSCQQMDSSTQALSSGLAPTSHWSITWMAGPNAILQETVSDWSSPVCRWVLLPHPLKVEAGPFGEKRGFYLFLMFSGLTYLVSFSFWFRSAPLWVWPRQ